MSSYRYMRTLLFFDLPTITASERKAAAAFRKSLVKDGFLMLQESVYCRMALNSSVEKAVCDVIRKNRPPRGVVQLLAVTEKQFSKMEFISGESQSDLLDSDERVVIF